MITSIPIASLITSTVAISLFITKEIRESLKKKKSNKIMLNGLCYMLNEHVSFNESVINEILKIKEHVNSDEYDSWSVEYIGDNIYVKFKIKDKSKKGILITMPRYDFFEKEIKELSILNKELFDAVIVCISAMQNLRTRATILLAMLHENRKGSKTLDEFITTMYNTIDTNFNPALLSVKNKCKLITDSPN
ncbi:hypothetical protein [Morganella morganii]|uniref:hypothetical protein n=1 Tax=Morganella morganii TaxID=582 RepID=UPI0034D73DB1